jgi:Flp pilus assembly secretin CpaC
MDQHQVIRVSLSGFLGALILSGGTGLATYSTASAAELALGVKAFSVPSFLKSSTFSQPAPQPQVEKRAVATPSTLKPVIKKAIPAKAVSLGQKPMSRNKKKVVLKSKTPKVTASRLVAHAPIKAQPKNSKTVSSPLSHSVRPMPMLENPIQTTVNLPSGMVAQGGPELAQALPILNLPSEKTPTAAVAPSRKVTSVATKGTAKKSRSKKAKVRPTDVAGVKSVSSDPLVLKSGIASTISEVDLTMGRAKILDLQSSVARVSISNPDVAGAVIVSPNQIQLVGKAPGVANLILWSNANSNRYTVVDINVHKDVSVLNKQLKMLDARINVEPMAAQNTVVLSGEADTAEAAQVAVELAKAFFMMNSQGGGGAAGGMAGGGGAGGAAGGAGGGAGGQQMGMLLTSLAPGTSLPGMSPQIVNMIKVKGMPTTKLELVRERLRKLDSNIQLDVIPAAQGAEKVILTGRVATSGVISKAINIASVFYGQPGMKVITGPGGKMIRPTGSSSFQTDNAFDDNLDINILQGSVVTDTTGNVVSMLEVAEKPQIRCSIRFLNVQRTALRQLGGSILGGRRDLSFGSFSASQSPLAGRAIAAPSGSASANQSGTFNYRGVPNPASKTGAYTSNFAQALGTGVTQVFTINQVFQLAISALEERRKVKSLAEPTLTLLSGEKASFLAGGELPIPVLGTNGQISIDYHQFGIRLNLIGTVNDDGKIHLQVAPEVSTVDPTNSITTTIATIPGFATRRMQTTLELNNGESFVLAGLFSQEESEIFSRFPGVGSLPILGTFFKGKNSDARSNEMIVIIRPEIVSSPNGQIWQTSTSSGGVGNFSANRE